MQTNPRLLSIEDDDDGALVPRADCPEPVELVAVPVPVEPAPDNPAILAAWAVLGIIVGIALFDILMLWLGKDTISRMIQRVAKGRSWFKFLSIVGIVMATWHVLWGFPKWLTKQIRSIKVSR